MSVFKVALVQHKAIPLDKEANLQLALRYARQAGAMGADLVLFPEMWSNAYAPPFDGAFDDPLRPGFDRERTAWLQNAIERNSEYVLTLRAAAKELGIGICATYLSKTAAKPQNTAIVIGRTGEILLEYAKVHTCDFSLEKLLACGSGFEVCRFDGVQLGVMICYDREFPESARVLMLKGAEIILVPNACDMNPARINQLSARAFENMTGIAMANYPGEGWGTSCAFSPIVFDGEGKAVDNTLMKASDIAEKILIAEFDMEKIRAYRKNETWGNAYRKPHAYADLLSTEVKEPFLRD